MPVGVEKVFSQNIFSAANVPERVFLSLTSLSGNLQNGSYGWAEEPHQAFDVLHCRYKEELLTYELDPT